MAAEELRPILENIVSWGGITAKDLIQKHGDETYRKLTTERLVEVVETSAGTTLYLSRPGRMSIGLTNEHHPTVEALVNNTLLRRCIEELLAEGYTNPIPRFYGQSHARMIDPQGKIVAVTARSQGYQLRAFRLLMANLFKTDRYPELSRLVMFDPNAKKLKKYEQKYAGKLEMREIS